MSSIDHSTQIQRCIDRMRAGDAAAREDLLAHACDRLTRLTRKMLRDFPGVKRWEQTDDVRQNALLRLCRALEQVQPPTAGDFFRLSAALIRRELLDLARRYCGAAGRGARGRTVVGASAAPVGAAGIDSPETTHDPSRLATWTVTKSPKHGLLYSCSGMLEGNPMPL